MMPAIVRSRRNPAEVLMLGYMNRRTLEKTEATGKVLLLTHKQRLWTKG